MPSLRKIVSEELAGESQVERLPALRATSLRPYLPDAHLLRATCRACAAGSARIITLTWEWCRAAEPGDRLMRAGAPAGALVLAGYGVHVEGRGLLFGILAGWLVTAATLAPRKVWARVTNPAAAAPEAPAATPAEGPEPAPLSPEDVVRAVRQIAAMHDWSGVHLTDLEEHFDTTREHLLGTLSAAGIEVAEQLKLRLPNGHQRNRQGVRLRDLPEGSGKAPAAPVQHPVTGPCEGRPRRRLSPSPPPLWPPLRGPGSPVGTAGRNASYRPPTRPLPTRLPHPNRRRTAMIQVVIQSIGLLHPGARAMIGDGLYYDLSDKLRNPANDRSLRYKTGLDPAVRDHVLGTPGAMQIVERIAEQARGALDYADKRHRLVRVTIACRGGKHRSVAIAEEAARYLRTAGIQVEVDHRHIDLPVVE